MFDTVLPALALWFATLTAAFRFRVFERALGLDRLRGSYETLRSDG